MQENDGGCLCCAIRYRTAAPPLRVTICHCRFCQRATGSAYMVEPIFGRSDFSLSAGAPETFEFVSQGSGKYVTVNFCAVCGTKLFLTFERFPDVIGVYGGTFDDPDWFARRPDSCRHIFTDCAQNGTVIPAGFPTFAHHVAEQDGTPALCVVPDHLRVIGTDG